MESIFTLGFILATGVLLLNGGRIYLAGGVSLLGILLISFTGLADTLLSITQDYTFNVILLQALSLFIFSLPLWWASPKYCTDWKRCLTLLGFILFLLMEWIVTTLYLTNINFSWEYIDVIVNTIALLLIIIPNLKGTANVIHINLSRVGGMFILRGYGLVLLIKGR